MLIFLRDFEGKDKPCIFESKDILRVYTTRLQITPKSKTPSTEYKVVISFSNSANMHSRAFKTQREVADAVEEIYVLISKQIPSTTLERIKQ